MRKTSKGVFIALTAASFGISAPALAKDKVEKAGDILQVILPVTAAVCAYNKQDFGSYAGRYVIGAAITQGLKKGLGNRSINIRPNGGPEGFPSGHATAAFYGATYLAHHCVQKPGTKALAYGLAAFVAGSRVHANKHNVAQVLAGALIGYLGDTLTVSFPGRGVRLGMRFDF